MRCDTTPYAEIWFPPNILKILKIKIENLLLDNVEEKACRLSRLPVVKEIEEVCENNSTTRSVGRYYLTRALEKCHLSKRATRAANCALKKCPFEMMQRNGNPGSEVRCPDCNFLHCRHHQRLSSSSAIIITSHTHHISPGRVTSLQEFRAQLTDREKSENII